jgi:hypothetical protein
MHAAQHEERRQDFMYRLSHRVFAVNTDE